MYTNPNYMINTNQYYWDQLDKPSRVDKLKEVQYLVASKEYRDFIPYCTCELVPQIKFDTGIINNYPQVDVINNNPIDIILDNRKEIKGFKIVVSHHVGEEFDGFRLPQMQGIRDDIIFLRTNFISSFTLPNNNFPIKCENDRVNSVYTPDVKILSNAHGEKFSPKGALINFSLVTSVPIKNPELKPYKDKMGMTDDDVAKTMKIVDNIFQIAIRGNVERKPIVLILSPFGNNEIDNNLVDDTIEIYNYFICKYGHCIPNIIIAIPKNAQSNIFPAFQQGILTRNYKQEITK